MIYICTNISYLILLFYNKSFGDDLTHLKISDRLSRPETYPSGIFGRPATWGAQAKKQVGGVRSLSALNSDIAKRGPDPSFVQHLILNGQPKQYATVTKFLPGNTPREKPLFSNPMIMAE